ncbi:hypothetical protein [Chitinophaga sp. YIM B06452]|uniref:hypothetical protein n=1 Tax=Chitinophaga sp. YIM B06452 TaxID=3082158 RepID=UPI0031FEECE7
MKTRNPYAPAWCALALAAMCCILSCEKDDAVQQNGPLTIATIPVSDTLSGFITENTLLTARRDWRIKGIVYVMNEATLEIDSGAVIGMMHGGGKEGNAYPASGIVVFRGAKIVAKGDSAHPIIFRITDSLLYRPDAWNGIIVLGKAPSARTEISISHQPWIHAGMGYGGDFPDDSSGVLQHIRFERNTTRMPAGNRFESGIHLISTGTRTQVKNVEMIIKKRRPLN